MRNTRDSLDEIQHLLRGSPDQYDDDEYSHRDIPLTQSPTRWCALAGYLLSASSISLLMSSTWLLTGALSKLYAVDSFLIQLFSYIFWITPLVMTIPASYVVSSHSLTTSLTIAVLCISIGAWLRSFINDNISLAFSGQCVAALGVSFFYNAPSQISAKWFYPQNRSTATLILTLCPFLFSFITPSLSTFIIDRSASQITPDQIDQYRQRVGIYFKFEAIIVTLSGCIGLLIFKEKPKSPPSQSEKAQRESFLTSFQIFKKCSYLLSLSSAGLSVGIFNAITIFSEDMLLQRGLNRNEIGLVYLIYIPLALGMTLGCALITRLLQKSKFLILLCQTGLLLINLLQLAFYDSLNSSLFMILLVIQAGLVAPITGLTLQSVADMTFPVVETFSAGFVTGAICMWSLIITLVLKPLISTQKQQLVFVVLVLAQGLALLSTLGVNAPRRLADSDDFILFKEEEQQNRNTDQSEEEQEEEP